MDLDWWEHYKKPAIGEVGILHSVQTSVLSDTFHIIMQHEGCEYMGTLLFDDPQFCQQIEQLLYEYCGKSIRQIGDIDLSHTL